MSVFLEGRLCFEFGSSWQVEKYDEHSSYRQGIARLSGGIVCEKCQKELECPDCHHPPGAGTKAVDFVGRRSTNDGQLYFIEVKDFRGHGRENRSRIGDALATEVAFKVRDTLAGLVGICHCKKDSQKWSLPAELILTRPPQVFLWLEEDASKARLRKRGQPDLDPVRERLREKLDWLGNCHVAVKNQGQDPDSLRRTLDLVVDDLPNCVYELRRIVEERKTVSRKEFAVVSGLGAQAAGEKLVELCDQQFFARGPTKDQFVKGARWGEFYRIQ